MVQFPLSSDSHPELELLKRQLSRRIPIAHLAGATAQKPTSSATVQQRIAAEINARRQRERRFGSKLFSDPAWDILLALYAARLRSEAVSATELCIASTAPAGVALRWISVLERDQLLVQHDEPKNPCRVRLELTDKGADLMYEHFAERSL
jgi:hypothetical protein